MNHVQSNTTSSSLYTQTDSGCDNPQKGKKKYIKHTLSAVSIYGNVILTSYFLLVSYSAFLLKSEACH